MSKREIKIDPAELRKAISYALDNDEEQILADATGALYYTSTCPKIEEIPTVEVWSRFYYQDFLDEHNVLGMSKEERSAAIHHMAGDVIGSMGLITTVLTSSERDRFLKVVRAVTDTHPRHVADSLRVCARKAFDESLSNDWNVMREAGEREVCRCTANNLSSLSAHRYDTGDIPPFIKDERQRAALALCAEAGSGVYKAALNAVLKTLPRPKEYKLFLWVVVEFGRLYTITSMN